MGVNLNLAISIFGFLLTAIFIFIMCCRLLCSRFRQSQRAIDLMRENSLGILGNREGLEQSVVASFPTINYKNHLFKLDEDNLCTVCLGEYKEKELLQIIPHCYHVFHVDCIGEWLKQHHTCPICRISLRDTLQRKHYSARQWAMYSKFVPGALHDDELDQLKNFSTIATEALHQAMIGVDDRVLDLETGESLEGESDEEIRRNAEGTSNSVTSVATKSSLYTEMLKESNDFSAVSAFVPLETYREAPIGGVDYKVDVEVGESSNKMGMESSGNDEPINQTGRESDGKKRSDIGLNSLHDVCQLNENSINTRPISVLREVKDKESKNFSAVPVFQFSGGDNKNGIIGIDQVCLKHIGEAYSNETEVKCVRKEHDNKLNATTERTKVFSTVTTSMENNGAPHLQTMVATDREDQG